MISEIISDTTLTNHIPSESKTVCIINIYKTWIINDIKNDSINETVPLFNAVNKEEANKL